MAQIHIHMGEFFSSSGLLPPKKNPADNITVPNKIANAKKINIGRYSLIMSYYILYIMNY